MLAPGAPPVLQIAREVGVTTPTLYRWRDDSLRASVEEEDTPPDVPKNRSELTALDKAGLITEAEDLSEEERGAFLRRHGIYQAELLEWVKALQEALDPAIAKKRKAEDPYSSNASR